jgi:hypothetical protein
MSLCVPVKGFGLRPQSLRKVPTAGRLLGTSALDRLMSVGDYMADNKDEEQVRYHRNIAPLMQTMAELFMKMNATERGFWMRFMLDQMEAIAARNDTLAEYDQFLHELYHLLTSQPSYTWLYPTTASRRLLN